LVDYHPIVQRLPVPYDYQVDVLRLDLVDEVISGNKWFKLKHNLQKAQELNVPTILTFGGAHSNHIAATAGGAKRAGLKAIGIIRGEEGNRIFPTLRRAEEDGMQLHFVSREMYAKKMEAEFEKYLFEKFGEHYLVPEGGNNAEGAMGCMEIMQAHWNYDHVFCACGTATTYAGLVAAAKDNTKLIGISVLKGDNTLPQEAMRLLKLLGINNQTIVRGNEALTEPLINGHAITNQYCFSGYAGYDETLIDFKNNFEKEYNIPLDYVYTSKLFYAVDDLLKKGKLRENSKLLIVHSGGLQGNEGFEKRYQRMPSR
jgi:1-aminocyclopropane-1-carboxylate deaminase